MATINCISNCIYQLNGKCTLQNVQSITSSANDSCAYFTNKESETAKNNTGKYSKKNN